jgi:hypothetical protein
VAGFVDENEQAQEDDKIFFEPDDDDYLSAGVIEDSDLFSKPAELPEVDYLGEEDIPELDFDAMDDVTGDQFDGTLFDDVHLDDEVTDYSDDIEASSDDLENMLDEPPDSDESAIDIDNESSNEDHAFVYDPLTEAESAPSQPWATRGVMALALIVVLGGLLAYSARNTSSFSAITSPVSNLLCKVSQCVENEHVSLDELKVVRRNVYTHPKIESALIINIVFKNMAAFAQPYPILSITMSDINGAAVAQRDFLPREYLKLNNTEPTGLIDSLAQEDISLEVNDPGSSAKSFELEFK